MSVDKLFVLSVAVITASDPVTAICLTVCLSAADPSTDIRRISTSKEGKGTLSDAFTCTAQRGSVRKKVSGN